MLRPMLCAAGAVALLGALATPVAVAGKPERVRLAPYERLDPAGAACPEALAPAGIHWTDAGGNGAVSFFENGRMLTTGRHPDRVTNVATGESLVLRLQGSGEGAPRPDGTYEMRLSGTTAFTFLPGDVGPGDDATGRIYVFTGNVRVLLDAGFAVVAFESSGTREDVCAMLA